MVVAGVNVPRVPRVPVRLGVRSESRSSLRSLKHSVLLREERGEAALPAGCLRGREKRLVCAYDCICVFV